MPTPIDTITIIPKKDMPLEIFRECYRLSFFISLMERLPDGRVLWDESCKEWWCPEDIAEVDYIALQRGWYTSQFEVPKAFLEKNNLI